MTNHVNKPQFRISRNSAYDALLRACRKITRHKSTKTLTPRTLALLNDLPAPLTRTLKKKDLLELRRFYPDGFDLKPRSKYNDNTTQTAVPPGIDGKRTRKKRQKHIVGYVPQTNELKCMTAAKFLGRRLSATESSTEDLFSEGNNGFGGYLVPDYHAMHNNQSSNQNDQSKTNANPNEKDKGNRLKHYQHFYNRLKPTCMTRRKSAKSRFSCHCLPQGKSSETKSGSHDTIKKEECSGIKDKNIPTSTEEVKTEPEQILRRDSTSSLMSNKSTKGPSARPVNVSKAKKPFTSMATIAEGVSASEPKVRTLSTFNQGRSINSMSEPKYSTARKAPLSQVRPMHRIPSEGKKFTVTNEKQQDRFSPRKPLTPFNTNKKTSSATKSPNLFEQPKKLKSTDEEKSIRPSSIKETLRVSPQPSSEKNDIDISSLRITKTNTESDSQGTSSDEVPEFSAARRSRLVQKKNSKRVENFSLPQEQTQNSLLTIKIFLIVGIIGLMGCHFLQSKTKMFAITVLIMLSKLFFIVIIGYAIKMYLGPTD